MYKVFVKKLRVVVGNPYINIIVGLLFLYSGVSETIEQLENVSTFTIGAHHGVILFSILHILKFVPDLFEGIEYVEKGSEK